MATKEEFEAVYGPLPAGTTSVAEFGEFGDGGCIAVVKGRHLIEIVGRWSSRADAVDVLEKLRTLPSTHVTYKLQAFHRWMGKDNGTFCRECGVRWTIEG